ncbi:cell wall-associated protease [Heyndrickxia sporothermodurans]|nr:cell wall-associated protease [Heyndrickxia sporothermodurans]
MKKVSKITALLLVFTLIVGFMIPQKYQAETVSVTPIEEATTITNGKVVEGTFEQPDVHWYKITPTSDQISKYSHMKLEVKSDQMVNVFVYSSKENAEKDQTFEQYAAGTAPDAPAVIQFPYAWDGPYYIKVEYYGFTEDPEIPLEGVELGPANYSMSTSSVKLPPNEEASSGDCPVEFSASGKKSGKDMLKAIRLFRDGILSKTKEGRQLSSLYYKSAPFLAFKLAFSKSMRDEVYDNLVVLQPLVNDLNKNGVNSTRVISKDEEKAINALFDIASNAVPAKLKSQMDDLAEKIGLTSLAGERLIDVSSKAGMKLPDSSKGKYIVKLKPGKKLSSLQSKTKGSKAFSSLSAVKKEDALFDNMYVVDMNDEQYAGMSASSKEKTLQATIKQVEKLPEVEFVEPVQTFHTLSKDIQSPYQWSLKNLGGDEGKKGADIQNDKLQNLVNKRNVKDTLIAVVDTGVDYTLSDLKNRVRTDIGKNFVDKSLPPMDDNGHGTHVSGIIAAESNNGYSMEGINQKAKIMPVKVLNAGGSGDTEQIAYGIKYAVDHGAKVINLSLGGQYSRVLEYVLKYAASKNVVVVAASGNDGQFGLSYPASSQYVISVGATNALDLVSDYSNYGVGLDLVAPGTKIPSLVQDGNVTLMSGTSMATPHVAAVAGLLLSKNPKLKVADIRNIFHETSDYVAFKETDNKGVEGGSIIDLIGGGGGAIGIDPDEFKLPIGSDLVSGYGRLNAFSAFSTVDLNVKVNPIADNQSIVTGSAVKGSKVQVKKGSKVIGKATVSSKGIFSVKIPVQKSKQRLQVIVTDSTGMAKATLAIYVKKGKAPAAPKVNTISNKTTYVTGKAQPEANVVIKNASKKIIGQGKTNAKGEFKVKIKKQKAGTALYLTSVDLAKRTSSAVKVVVKDKIAPAAPKVNAVTSQATAVKGKAEKSSTVTVKTKSKTLGKAKADKKGNFSVKIKKQKSGTVLYVTAKDKAGNISKVTKVTVKK